MAREFQFYTKPEADAIKAWQVYQSARHIMLFATWLILLIASGTAVGVWIKVFWLGWVLAGIGGH